VPALPQEEGEAGPEGAHSAARMRDSGLAMRSAPVERTSTTVEHCRRLCGGDQPVRACVFVV